jgi:hypothetical protein
VTDPTIIEAAARALDTCIEGYQVEAVLAAVTPLIRAQVLEEAAQVAEEMWGGHPTQDAIAAAIRALKEQP